MLPVPGIPTLQATHTNLGIYLQHTWEEQPKIPGLGWEWSFNSVSLGDGELVISVPRGLSLSMP